MKLKVNILLIFKLRKNLQPTHNHEFEKINFLS